RVPKKMDTGENPLPAAGGACGSEPHKLGDEERAAMRRVLRQAGIEATSAMVERLADAIQASMDLFRENRAGQFTHRERHDAIRALLRLAEEDDPPVGMIRKRITELAEDDIAYAGERAERLRHRVFPGESLPRNFVVWSQTAPQGKLLEAVR